MAFIFASLFGFKVYTGIFAVVGLFFLGLYNFVKKREKKSILLFTATVILGLIIYLPVNSQAGGLYFSRFYIFENFIVQPWMALDRLELTRQVYVDHHNIPRIMEYELLYIVLYVITVFGFKNLAFFQTKKSLSYFNTELHLFLGGGLFISAILGFFFQQSTGGSNTFNFLTLVFIISSFYTALACWYWLSRFPMAISVLATVSIILLSLPRIGNDFVNNVQSITQYKTFIIPSPEMQALEFLKINGDKQKLVFIPDPNKDKDGKDLYITIYTNMPMFLSAQRILESHGIQTAQREKIQQALINTASPEAFLKIARKNNIGYMYIRNTNSIPMLRKQTLLPIIYENKFGTIYKL